MAKSVEVYKQMQHNAEIQQYISPKFIQECQPNSERNIFLLLLFSSL
jgi:hypothetical protein